MLKFEWELTLQSITQLNDYKFTEFNHRFVGQNLLAQSFATAGKVTQNQVIVRLSDIKDGKSNYENMWPIIPE